MPAVSITGSELAAARTRFGLTPEQFAAELGIPPHSYAACEAGTARLPRYQAEMVAFRVACADRDEALAHSGLPTCSWIEKWDGQAPPPDAKAEQLVTHFERAERHAKTCETCQARERFVRERFPEMPKPPVSGGMRIVGAVISWIEARPDWSRPAFYGAAILAAMTAFRAFFMLFAAFREPRVLLPALGAIVVASLAGAGGGLVYSFLGRPARRIPVVGPYLAGIIAVAGYMGSVLALMAFAGGDASIVDDPGSAIFVFGFVSILFGLLIGHKMFRPKEASS